MWTAGYKLHQQISKALQQRSETIRKAIVWYNAQAAMLNPPRPPVLWKDITQYTFLGEFDLLRHTWDDVRERIWAKPAIREATAKFFKLCRAKEEITRLNVEVRRLRTAIHDEEKEVSQTILNLRGLQPLLAYELEHLHQRCTAVNGIHINRLHQLEKQYGLVGSTGTCKVFHSVDGHMVSPEPVAQDGGMVSPESVAQEGGMAFGDAGDALADFQDGEPALGEDCIPPCNCLYNSFLRTIHYLRQHL